jgi:phosphatidylcholine synthase
MLRTSTASQWSSPGADCSATDVPAMAAGMRRGVAAAWLVHLYTATGLIAAAVAATLIVRGDQAALRGALLMFILATLVDATDGALARRYRVAERIPGFDGRRLDDIIDFQTYTSLPLLLVWRADLLPGALGWILLIPLLASAYGFAQDQAKTDDGYFLGFPSYWNVVAFYLFFLQPAPWFSAATVLLLALMTMLPTRYLYLSMSGALNRVVAASGTAWGILLVLLTIGVVPQEPWLLLSLAFPAIYMIASWTLPLQERIR